MGISATGQAKPWGENIKDSAIRAGAVTAAGGVLGTASTALGRGGISLKFAPVATGISAAVLGAPVLASSISANATNFPHVLFDTGVGAVAAGAASAAGVGLTMKGVSGGIRGGAMLGAALIGGGVGTGVSYLNHVFMN
jgi:hypothetical protein